MGKSLARASAKLGVVVVLALSCSQLLLAASVEHNSVVSPNQLGPITYKDVLVEEWKLFKQMFNRTYDDENEDNFRFRIFLDNKLKIAKHNQRAGSGEHRFTLKLNQYADMEHSEFVKTMNGYKPALNKTHVLTHLSTNEHVLRETAQLMREPDSDVKIPSSLDWRQHGLVTSVKDQGRCGSCWAFSSTGALEGQHFKKTGNLISLSEQNLVDCSKKYGNMGCEGGIMEKAFEYVRDNHGVDTENSYPYEAHDSKCRFKSKTVGADDKGYVSVPRGDERKLLQAVAMKGPVSVAIDASHESFRFYDAGVYDEPQCENKDENLDHGVLVVGYGSDPVGGPYWLVKNSWSETWGNAGYIKMARNKNNQCGIATSAVYPVV